MAVPISTPRAGLQARIARDEFVKGPPATQVLYGALPSWPSRYRHPISK